MSGYESRPETYAHIAEVRGLLLKGVMDLLRRSHHHDQSKLEPPEVETFNEFTPKLKDLTYGSDEYRECLRAMKPALEHHYAHNRHHPEHFANGVLGMDLFDLVEMLSDWIAASRRTRPPAPSTDEGTDASEAYAAGIRASMSHNRERARRRRCRCRRYATTTRRVTENLHPLSGAATPSGWQSRLLRTFQSWNPSLTPNPHSKARSSRTGARCSRFPRTSRRR